MDDRPEYGKLYSLTGKSNSIANGDGWKDSEVKPDKLHKYYKGKVVAKKTKYDYKNQAWTVEGKYIRCGHPDSMNCNCYGKLHEGETAFVTLKADKSVDPSY